jgi:hypothetical protein
LGVKHNRRVLTFWIWVAILGGITQSCMIFLNWCVLPFSKHGFQLRAAKRLYFARTQDPKLFKSRPHDGTRYKRDFEELNISVEEQAEYEGGGRSKRTHDT